MSSSTSGLGELVGAYAAEQDPQGWEQLRFGDDRRGDWAKFRREIQEAKEILSEDERVTIFVPATSAEVSVTRAEFEDLIRADLERTASLFGDAVAAAGLTVDELDAVYLTGGASRVPLVERVLREHVGVDPHRWGDPKAVVVSGAVVSATCAKGGGSTVAEAPDAEMPATAEGPTAEDPGAQDPGAQATGPSGAPAATTGKVLAARTVGDRLPRRRRPAAQSARQRERIDGADDRAPRGPQVGVG